MPDAASMSWTWNKGAKISLPGKTAPVHKPGPTPVIFNQQQQALKINFGYISVCQYYY
jgi:hypothetical protein